MRRYLPLLAVGVALIALLAIAVLMLANNQPTTPTAAPPQPAAAASASPASTSPTLAGTDAAEGGLDAGTAEELQAEWGPVVTRFGRRFTNTQGGHKAWMTRLAGDPRHPDVTEGVLKQLAGVDIDNVPRGKFESMTFIDGDQFTANAKVTYNTGWSMIVAVNTDGVDWQVSSYDKLDES